jgi:hypothetical protein
LHLRFHRLLLLPASLALCVPAQAQESRRAEIADRFNAGISFSVVHDSSIGWYDVLTPAIGYTFSPHLSADVSASLYPYRLTQNQAANVTANDELLPTHFDAGDTFLSLHGSFSAHTLQHTVTALVTAPTGDRPHGLGTGRVTFDLRDHIERYAGHLRSQPGLVLDLGVGDSSGLFNRLVQDQSNTLGPIAHFQTGLILWLPGREYLQSVAYEQLPLGDQKIYATQIPRPGAPPRTIVTGRGVSEDNGFTTSLGIPLTAHLTATSYYNRSLRLHLDTVSVGLTFALRGTPVHRRMSLIDRAMREAEGANP